MQAVSPRSPHSPRSAMPPVSPISPSSQSSARSSHRRSTTRSTTGCIGCRLRRKKCSEEKPHCANCGRNGILCTYPRPGDAKHSELLRRTNPTGGQRGRRAKREGSVSSTLASMSPATASSPYSPGWQGSDDTLALSLASDEAILSILHRITPATIPSYPPSSSSSLLPLSSSSPTFTSSIPVSPNLLDHGLLRQPTSRRFLHHYIHRTYRVMAVCQGTRNPFLWELIPMAMGSDLVLNALLAFSGIHYADLAGVAIDETTWLHYGQTIQGAKFGLTQLAKGNKELLVPLLVAVILLCILETFRTDAGSAALDHLRAARALLLEQVLPLPASQLSQTMRAFLVERYTYTMVLAHITMGSEADQWVLDDTALLFPMIQTDASAITDTKTAASSCVHELFCLIPRVSVLARQWGEAHRAGQAPSPRARAEYARLHDQLTAWQPTSNDEANTVCGRLYQQALLVYLAASCGGGGGNKSITDDVAGSLMSVDQEGDQVHEAFDTFLPFLSSIPLDAATSTTLCWPLVVFGACARDARHRDAIAHRLDSLSCTYAAQSVRDARELLQRLWDEDNPEAANPLGFESMMRRAGKTVLFL